MGTYYRITCENASASLQDGIDSILQEYNIVASTYIDSSIISSFNYSRDSFLIRETGFRSKMRIGIFINLLNYSFNIYENSYGYFDPTVMPIVNYFGFGYNPKDDGFRPDSSEVDSILQFIGLNNIKYQTSNRGLVIYKNHPGVQLDFSAIAKGMAVDAISNWLLENGYVNHLVDIGGEVSCTGLSPRRDQWVSGINIPDPSAVGTDIYRRIGNGLHSVATSGNYRNFRTLEGVTYGHTINPKTGWPERNEILSATVIASSCAIADGWATAFMAMGEERATKLIENISGIEAMFIVHESGEYSHRTSSGFGQYVLE